LACSSYSELTVNVFTMCKVFYFLMPAILISAALHTSIAQDLSVVQRDEIKKQVDDIFTKMIADAEKLDYDKLDEGVDDRYHAGFIVNNRYYADFASLLDVVKSGSQGVSKQVITVNNKKITVLAEDLVLVNASGISEVTLDDGRQFNVNFFWSFVYRKFGDQWKVIQSHQSRSG